MERPVDVRDQNRNEHLQDYDVPQTYGQDPSPFTRNSIYYEMSDIRPISRTQYQEHVTLLGQRRRRRPVELSWPESTGNFWSRTVDYFGEYKAVPETDPAAVCGYVEGFVEDILRQVQGRDLRFHGTLKSGGVNATTGALRINKTNEFVYILELSKSNVDVNDMIVAYANIKSGNHRRIETVFGRSYFSLSFKDAVPKHWASTRGSRIGPQSPSDLSVNPQRLLEDFRGLLDSLSHPSGDLQVTSRGADVVIHAKLPRDIVRESFATKHGLFKLKQHADVEDYLLEISISLAIPVDRVIPTAYWPLQGYGDRQLDLQVAKQSVLINKCHLVADGGLWRVDFSRWQSYRIRQLTENRGRRVCYQALVNMSHHLGLADAHSDHLLRMNALKLAFLKENSLYKDDKDWRPSSVADRVSSILHEVEHGVVQGRSSTQSSGRDDGDHERSGEVARKLRDYLDTLDRQYHADGLLHFVGISVLFLCGVILFLLGIVYLSDGDLWRGLYCGVSGRSAKFLPYTQGHLSLAFVSLTLSIVGATWIATQRFILRTWGVLYEMYRGLQYVYIVIAVLSLLEVIFGIGLAERFKEVAACQNSHSEDIKGLIAVTVVLSGLRTVTFIVHVVIFLVCTKGQVRRFSWEFVFFDKIYHELCPSTNRRKVDMPRVSVLVNDNTRTRSSADYSEYDVSQDDVDVGWGTGRRKPLTSSSNGGEHIRESPTSPGTDKHWPNTRLSRQVSEPHLSAAEAFRSRQRASDAPAQQQQPPASQADKYYSLQRPVRSSGGAGQTWGSPTSNQPYSNNTLPRGYQVHPLPTSPHQRASTLPRSPSRHPPPSRSSHDLQPLSPTSPDEVFMPNPPPNIDRHSSSTGYAVPYQHQMSDPGGHRGSLQDRMWLPDLDSMRTRQQQPRYEIKDQPV